MRIIKSFMKMLAAVAFVGFFVPQASATLLYENPALLAGRGESGNCQFQIGCVEDDIFGATEFTLAAANTVGSVSFTAILQPVEVVSLIGDWKIFEDGGAIPGSPIASGDNFAFATVAALTGETFTHFEFKVDIPDLALAGGTYWLAFRVVTRRFDPTSIFWSLGEKTVDNATSTDRGATWVPGYAAFSDGLAVAVYGADDPAVIPLPAALPLFLTGLAGLALIRRRQRQA